MDLNYDLVDWIEGVDKWIKSHRCIRAQLTFVLLRFLASSLALLGHMAVASTIDFWLRHEGSQATYRRILPPDASRNISRKWVPAEYQHETDQ